MLIVTPNGSVKHAICGLLCTTINYSNRKLKAQVSHNCFIGEKREYLGRPPRSFPTIQTLCKCLFFLSYFKVASRSRQRSSSVAAWLSETVLRSRGPGAKGRNLRRSMDVCVCLSGADGRVVEGRATPFRHHREVSRVRIPGRMGLPWMLCCVRFVSSRKGEERRGWAWVAGESTPEPRRTTKGKKGKISRPQETSKKLLEMPSIVSNESLSTMCDENRTRFGMPLVFTNILSDILNVPNEAVHHRESITSLVELLEESRRVIRQKSKQQQMWWGGWKLFRLLPETGGKRFSPPTTLVQWLEFHRRDRGSVAWQLQQTGCPRYEYESDGSTGCPGGAPLAHDTARSLTGRVSSRRLVVATKCTDHTLLAHTLAVAVFVYGDCGRAVHPKLHTGPLQVLPDHPTQPRNVAL
ncbi:hypothetical protein GEV33_014014 [Tenebrio molitor]|uniref:Uncharacterized protein n=1 Tax=Tenebrio molitor TaxID=7067 RepID=A0A8J6LDC7_TENMO|nr:hypothetical protein GEV33_014014 [Tenebrio molitor]